jgi:hypothetical protein
VIQPAAVLLRIFLKQRYLTERGKAQKGSMSEVK